MAKILYGVHGSLHGHAIRALTVARNYPEHEFLFVSYGDGAAILRREFPVVDCPTLLTEYKSHKVATIPTLLANLRVWSRKKRLTENVLGLIEGFQPDMAFSDYEFLVPRACRERGVPCLSIDHQHVITLCRHRLPLFQLHNYLFTALLVRSLFSQASDYMIVSFFRAPLKSGDHQLVPPLLREAVLQVDSSDGEHVLAYVSKSTSEEFLRFLHTIERPVVIYGPNLDRVQGNLHFKESSEAGLLKDLAACCYVISGGGHTLMSEALHYGKPILSFPMGHAFEQFMNAFYLEKLGYGQRLPGLNNGSGVVRNFESRLDRYRRNIRREDFCGNPLIFSLLDYFIGRRSLRGFYNRQG